MVKKILFPIFLLLVALIFSSGYYFSEKGYQGSSLSYFDGSVFRNTSLLNFSFLDYVELAVSFPFKKKAWPDRLPLKQRKVRFVSEDQLGLTFIGHSTFLIQVDGFNILTDPIFSDRASPAQWMGPRRVRKPAILFEHLPPIDLILISHNHYDHLDEGTIKKLINRQPKNPPFILAPLGNKRLLEKWGALNAVDLAWGESVFYQNLKISLQESRHRSGRGFFDQMKTLWGAFIIESQWGKIYFAGDTGYGPHFKNTFLQFGSMDLSLIPIGAYEPRWFMSRVHMTPEEAVGAHMDLGSKKSIGIHFGTFQLTYEGYDQPLKDLEQSVKSHSLEDQEFSYLKFGETRFFEKASLPSGQ